MNDDTAKLVRTYFWNVGSQLNPIAVEEKFELVIPGVPIPIIGYIDVEEADKLIDWKTVARRTKPKPDWILQAGLYTAKKQKPLHFHVTTKTKTPAVYTPQTDPELAVAAWSTTRAASYVRRVVVSIQNLYSTLGPDEVWPGATMHPFACDYCGLRHSCAWWNE